MHVRNLLNSDKGNNEKKYSINSSGVSASLNAFLIGSLVKIKF